MATAETGGEIAATVTNAEPLHGAVSNYLGLVKTRLTTLVLLTALVAFWLASPRPIDLGALGALLLGTALVVGGANALNQVFERHTDKLMKRTRSRPIPAGRLSPTQASIFGISILAIGTFVLATGNNLLTAALGLSGFALYLFAYTPLKRISWICTIVGAVPGALPMLIGWAAARGSIDRAGWALFAILFVWQLPHFLAISRLNRDDYQRAGLSVLGTANAGGDAWQSVVWCLLLLPLGTLPTLLSITGRMYFAGSLLLGLMFLTASAAAAGRGTLAAHRRAFRASLVYLSVLLLLMVIDRVG